MYAARHEGHGHGAGAVSVTREGDRLSSRCNTRMHMLCVTYAFVRLLSISIAHSEYGTPVGY